MFIVDVDASLGIFVKFQREITSFSVAKGKLDRIFESIVILLDFRLFGPVEFGKDFNKLIGECGARTSLFEFTNLTEGGCVLIGIMETGTEVVDEGIKVFEEIRFGLVWFESSTKRKEHHQLGRN